MFRLLEKLEYYVERMQWMGMARGYASPGFKVHLVVDGFSEVARTPPPSKAAKTSPRDRWYLAIIPPKKVQNQKFKP